MCVCCLRLYISYSETIFYVWSIAALVKRVLIYALKLVQNGRHFSNDNFKFFFFNGIFWYFD